MARNRYYAGAPSDHFDGERFFNPGQAGTDRSLAMLLRWRTGKDRSPWPKRVANGPTAKPPTRVDGLMITMVGHATVLIQLAGYNLLVDPVWSARASPLRWAGPKRVNDPGIAFAGLPPIDAVLITHNHYDHFDIATLRRLERTHCPLFAAPLGNDALLAKVIAPDRIKTADWGETITLGDHPIRVTLVPAHHWSARALGDRRMALWCGFVIQSSEGLIYNAGDTAYGDGRIFFDIARNFGPPDVAILPIGAYEPRWFMKNQHANPDEAVRIMMACEARQGLGVHWGTFPLTDEARLAPKEGGCDGWTAAITRLKRPLKYLPSKSSPSHGTVKQPLRLLGAVLSTRSEVRRDCPSAERLEIACGLDICDKRTKIEHLQGAQDRHIYVSA